MNGWSQIQMMGISAIFSLAFFILLYMTRWLFKSELKGDWGLVAVAAFPFLAYAVLNVLSTDLLSKEIGLSVGVLNVQLIKDPGTADRLELSFEREVEPEARHGPKETVREVKEVIAEARTKKLTILLVDAARYTVDLRLVDQYASKSGYLFKHVVFVEGRRFLGYATPQQVDGYINSKGFDKPRDFYTHLRNMEVQTDTIYDTTSERETLAIMEKRGIETIAVLGSKTGGYRGLASRQQIAESMLSQLFEQMGKIRAAPGRPAQDEYVSTLKSIQREIQHLSRLQSQQLGILQGAMGHTSKRPETKSEDLDRERGQIIQQFVPGSR